MVADPDVTSQNNTNKRKMARAYYLFSYVYWIVTNETVFFLLNFF